MSREIRNTKYSEAPGWRSRKRLILLNTAVEFRRFAEYLHSLGHPVRIGFEATGNYHRALAHFLLAEGFHLELIASVAVARTREAMYCRLGVDEWKWHGGPWTALRRRPTPPVQPEPERMRWRTVQKQLGEGTEVERLSSVSTR